MRRLWRQSLRSWVIQPFLYIIIVFFLFSVCDIIFNIGKKIYYQQEREPLKDTMSTHWSCAHVINGRIRLMATSSELSRAREKALREMWKIRKCFLYWVIIQAQSSTLINILSISSLALCCVFIPSPSSSSFLQSFGRLFFNLQHHSSAKYGLCVSATRTRESGRRDRRRRLLLMKGSRSLI